MARLAEDTNDIALTVDKAQELMILKSQLSASQMKSASDAFFAVRKAFHEHHQQLGYNDQILIDDIKLHILKNILQGGI